MNSRNQYMRPTIVIFFLILFILCACQKNNDKQLNQDILGEWSYIKTENKNNYNLETQVQQPSFDGNIKGYVFLENNVCENKPGYFKRIKGNEIKEIFLGTRTKYKIEDESLKILDLSSKTWENQKIHSIVGDTLTMKISDKIFEKYARVKYKINPNEDYDKIIISSSGCYGTCPVSNISIDNDGNIFYYGQQFNSQNGFFKSKITKDEYQKIQTNFKKADIKSLEDNYRAHWTDDETVTITFIKNNKIVKSISDYGRKSPALVIWAYTPVRYLYQQIKLVPLKTKKPLLSIGRISFSKENQICDLTKSESFYLLTELFKGQETSSKFEHSYQIQLWNDEDKKDKIYTDGRYFKYKDRIIDIGYNFLAVNNLTDKFRQKNQYD